jgi:hypothetical protein
MAVAVAAIPHIDLCASLRHHPTLIVGISDTPTSGSARRIRTTSTGMAEAVSRTLADQCWVAPHTVTLLARTLFLEHTGVTAWSANSNSFVHEGGPPYAEHAMTASGMIAAPARGGLERRMG